MEVNTNDSLGRSIYNLGIYDLPVTEILFRLIQPGDFVVDVGANVGYTTGLCAFRVGTRGKVYAFEPNPLLQELLKRNLEKVDRGNITLYSIGLSDKMEIGRLVLPKEYEQNQGLGYVDKNEIAEGMEITLNKLDNLIDRHQTIDLMKIDVEGFELNVFRGALNILENKGIRHIVFEDHNEYPTPVSQLLVDYGYSIYRIEKGWFNVLLKDPSSKSKVSSFEPINYLATLDYQLVAHRLRKPGYQSLGRALL